MSTPNPTVWLTAAEAAEHARCSVWTIRQAVKDGDLPSFGVRTGAPLFVQRVRC